ncbi:DUF2291 domain-containing protein [Maribacter litopenaei]|uniref:DUF2291 domain-containing protein n=1 Tax=Maribacter litopenaei TaxID=2976127 RepID=A0ABY5Y4X8_9FLAO|nr:DUF2291 domain-containing protein [Maribacter litopenaei]UWX53929.1 DUF2291 domain-containing protein [Maribacter litopenaei]
MMGKLLKYSIITIIILIAGYNSVTLSPLDEVKKSQNDAVFNARAYAENFISNDVTSLPATEVTEFLSQISEDLDGYTEQYGKRLGISDAYNFILQGTGTVSSMEEEYVNLILENEKSIHIATDFIFGNAIRDGSAMADIGDYQNTMDFNSISVELNNIVREEIIPPFMKKAKVGDEVLFKGAVTVDVTDPQSDSLKIIPLLLKINE